MALEDDVVLKVAGDVSNIVAALDRLNEQFDAMFTRMTSFAERAEPAFKKTEQTLDGFFGKLVGGTTLGTFFGNQMSKAFDLVVDGVQRAATAIPRLIDDVAETGDRFLTLSQQTGISVKALSQFDFVASQTGTSLEGLTTSIFLMQRNLAAGGAGVSTALRKMKIDINDLKALRPEDAFVQLLSGLRTLPTQAEKASAGMALFGRNFRSIAQLTTEDIRKLMKEADKLGLTMTDTAAKMGDRFNDAKDRIARTFEGITRSIGVALLPAATRLLEGLAEISAEFFAELGLNAEQFGDSAEEVVDTLLEMTRQFAADIMPIARAIGDGFEAGLKVIPPLIAAIGTAFRSISPIVTLVTDLVGGLSRLPPVVLLVGSAFVTFAASVDKARVSLTLYNAVLRLTGPGMDFFNAAAAPLGAALMNTVRGAILATTITLNVWIARVGLAGVSMATWLPTIAKFAAALSTLGTAALAAGAGFVGWKIGTWLGEITGLTDGVARLTGALMGLEEAEVERSLTAQRAARAAVSEREALAQAEADALQRMKDLSSTATLLAEKGKLSEFQLKRIGREALALREQGVALSPVLQAIVTALEQMSAGASSAAEGLEQLTDAQKLQKFEALLLAQSQNTLSAEQKKAINQGLAQRRTLADIVAAMKEAGLATDEDTLAIGRHAEAYGKSNKASEALRNQTEELAIQMASAQRAGLGWAETVRILGPAAVQAAVASAQLTGGLERLSQKQRQLAADFQKLKLGEIFEAFDIDAFKRGQDEAARAITTSMDVLQKAQLQSFESLTDKTSDLLQRLTQERLSWRDREIAIIEDARAKEVKALGPLPEVYKEQYDKIVAARQASLEQETSVLEIARQQELRQRSETLKSLGVIGPAYEREYAIIAEQVNRKYDEMIAASAERVEREIRDLGPVPELYSRTYGTARESVEQNAARMRAALSGIVFDPELLAKQLGTATTTTLEQQLLQAERFLQQMRNSQKFTADDIIRQEQRVFEMRNRLRGLQDVRSRDQINADIAAERQKIATLEALGEEYNKEYIKQSKARIRQLEEERDGVSGFKKVWQGVMTVADDMANSFARLGQISGGLGGFMEKLGTAMSHVATIMKDIDGLVQAIISGNWIGAIVAAVKLAVDAIIAVWDAFTVSAGEDVARRLGQRFGVTFSEEFGNAIAANADLMFGGDRLTAEVAALADIISEGAKQAGISAADFARLNFDTLIREFRNVFALIESGNLTLEQANVILEENFNTLLTAGTDAYGRISDELREIIALNQQFGTESKAIGEFLKGQGTDLLSGFNSIAAGSRNFADLKKTADEAGEAMDGVFDTAKTVELAKKVEDAQKAVDKLGGRTKANAKEFDLAFAKLIKAEAAQRDWAEEVARVQDDFNKAIAEWPLDSMNERILDAQFDFDRLTKAGKTGTQEWLAAQEALNDALADQSAFMADAKAELTDLGTIALGSFATAVEAGVPWAEALKQAAPSLKQIRDSYEALGLKIEDVGLNALLTQDAIAQAAPEVLAGIDGLTKSFVALDNLGKQTPETFAAMQRTGERMFQRLVEEAEKVGGSSVDALLPMQQFLHEAERAARELGVPLDESTQKMIEASQAAGVWKEEQQSLNDIMISGFSAIIEALGGEIPAAWRKMVDAAKTATEEAAAATQEAAEKAATDTAESAEAAAKRIEEAYRKSYEESARYATEAANESGEATADFGEETEETIHRIVQTSREDWRVFVRNAEAAARAAELALTRDVEEAIDGIGDQLDDVDWEGWARDAVDAAGDVKDAVDAAALGESPGGVREIRTQLDLARQAANVFRREVVAQMGLVKAASEAVSLRSPDIGASMDRLSLGSVRVPTDYASAAAGMPSVYVAAGAFPISTWSVGEKRELIKKEITGGVLDAIHGGGTQYEKFESMVRKVRR